jgi:hypothetical protein
MFELSGMRQVSQTGHRPEIMALGTVVSDPK